MGIDNTNRWILTVQRCHPACTVMVPISYQGYVASSHMAWARGSNQPKTPLCSLKSDADIVLSMTNVKWGQAIDFVRLSVCLFVSLSSNQPPRQFRQLYDSIMCISRYFLLLGVCESSPHPDCKPPFQNKTTSEVWSQRSHNIRCVLFRALFQPCTINALILGTHCIDMCTHTDRHACMHARMHTHTHTHTHTYTHTHTHTHTYIHTYASLHTLVWVHIHTNTLMLIW